MHKANALLTSLFFLENLSAQPAPPPPGGQLFDHRFPPLFAEIPPLSRLESAEDSLSQLDLTPDQKTQIKQLNEADRQGLLAARDRVRIAREILDSAKRETPEDENSIKAKSEDFGEAMALLIGKESLHESKFLQILTTDQRDKLSVLQQRSPGGPPLDWQGPQPPDRLRSEDIGHFDSH
jgi:Spy/CpxP family protein refolding chaperone